MKMNSGNHKLCDLKRDLCVAAESSGSARVLFWETPGESRWRDELIVLGPMCRWQVLSPRGLSSLPVYSKGTIPEMLLVEGMRVKCKGMQVVVGLDPRGKGNPRSVRVGVCFFRLRTASGSGI
jgi:hypothetical protein